MIKAILLICTLTLFANAKELKDPEVIYLKKCQMCHALQGPENMEEKRAMAAPYITLAMKSVVTGVDAIEEPKNNKELRALVIEHIEDYIFNPTADKSYCEDIIFKNYNYMPSLKRFITPKQASIVAPWIYDNFAPIKYRED